MGKNQPVKVQDASTQGGTYRVAGRRLVTAMLHSCLVLDSFIACFDLHPAIGKAALCAGKLAHIYDLEDNTVAFTLGKAGGHRLPIRSCAFNASGTLLATGGEDSRIVVWNLFRQRTDKILEQHQGNIYALQFLSDDRLASSGDDGKVILWERAGAQVFTSVFQHPAPVRTLVLHDHRYPQRLLTGRTDGTVDVWDVAQSTIIDAILPESDWQERELAQELKGAGHALLSFLTPKPPSDQDHHAGSVLHLAMSPSGAFLATCSTDKTCKVWNVMSYQREDTEVTETLTDTREPGDRIDVWDEGLDNAEDNNELHIGSVDFKLGYHADVLWTLKHEAPVVSASFNRDNDLIITGALDCTLRFWSVRKGNLLFQINTPAAPRQIMVTETSYLYVICDNRVLLFSFKAAKETDVLAELEAQRLQFAQQQRQEQMDPAQRYKTLLAQERGASADGDGEGGPERFTMNEIRSLLAHGSLNATSLDTLLETNQVVDANQLRINMTTHDVKAGTLIKTMVQNDFAPVDMLHAFAARNHVNGRAKTPVKDLYSLVKSNSPALHDFLVQAGLRPMSRQDRAAVWPLKYADFRPYRSLEDEMPGRTLKKLSFPGLDDSDDERGRGGRDGSDPDDDDDGFGRRPSRGKLLHYIPSEAVTQQRFATGEATPRLRKIYLEPKTSRPPTTPMRIHFVSSTPEHLHLQRPPTQHPPRQVHSLDDPATHWRSSNRDHATHHAAPVVGRGSVSGLPPNEFQHRGRHYKEQFGDSGMSSFVHPPPNAPLDPPPPGGARRPRAHQHRSDGAGGPHYVGTTEEQGPLVVTGYGDDTDESDVEDYDEDTFDMSLIDKMASAYRGRGRRRRRRRQQRSRSRRTPSRDRSPGPSVALGGLSVLVGGPEDEPWDAGNGTMPGGHLKVGHIYSQPMVMQQAGTQELGTALRIGQPVKVSQHRLRPTFTN
ncbi:U3 snoRNP protein [Allomyces javanicus]|nr:U3 snoRNP protein [Allomyces javanicus]